MQEIIIKKSLEDLKINEPIEDLYVYMDHNKEIIEPMINDEKKILGLNIFKIVQKHSQTKISIKKVFRLIEDVKLYYDKDKDINHITIQILLKD